MTDRIKSALKSVREAGELWGINYGDPSDDVREDIRSLVEDGYAFGDALAVLDTPAYHPHMTRAFWRGYQTATR